MFNVHAVEAFHSKPQMSNHTVALEEKSEDNQSSSSGDHEFLSRCFYPSIIQERLYWYLNAYIWSVTVKSTLRQQAQIV